MEKPILSIIVPVYNVESFIQDCIGSLIKQTIESFEIIVVNDGSTDRSIDIVKAFNNDKIIIVNKEYEGVSAARNAGIKVARGKYIAFVDSDDFISKNTAYDEMVNILEENNGDIITGNASWYYNENKVKSMHNNIFKENIMSNEEYLITSIREKRIFIPVWLNIIKSSILKDNNLRFTEGILHEDEFFSLQLFLKANKIILYNKDFYMYRQREGSIMHSKNNIEKRLNDILYISKELTEISNDISNSVLKEEFKNYIAYFGLSSIYSAKVKVDKNLKILIKENSMRASLKRDSVLLSINEYIYYIYEFSKRKIKSSL